MVAPDHIPVNVLNQPTTLVNRFKIKDPGKYGDRYIYVPGSSFVLPGDHALQNVDIQPSRYPYTGIDLDEETYVYDGPAFVAWDPGTTSIPTEQGNTPVYEFRPRRPPSWPGHGRALELASMPSNPVWPDLPGFCVLDHDAGVDFVQPIYQHVGHDGNMYKYMYDLIPDAHDDWDAGTAAFYAAPAGKLLEELSRYAAAQTRRPPTGDDLSSKETLGQLSDATRGLLAPGQTIDQAMTDNLVRFFSGKGLDVQVFTTSYSADAGFLIGGSVERGVVWNRARGPIHNYTTLGAGMRIGAGGSVNPLNLGMWWGPSEQAVLDAMQGVGLYELLGATYGFGLNIILSCTTDFMIYGLTISPQAGIEVEIGGELGATYTSFYSVDHDTPGSMEMPHLVHG